jgi:para-nitrobenzyl esterase
VNLVDSHRQQQDVRDFFNFMNMLRTLFPALALLIQCTISTAQTVKTTRGYIQGTEEQGIFVFKGIPYASAARFKAPTPRPIWKDTLSCTAFGPVAPQFDGKVVGEEDCLRLNLYTPGLKGKKPVVVWVHGGGMTGGTGMWMNGHAFADHDSIITITINYRLGALGFLYLNDIPGYETAPNNAVLDLIASLQWIKENIAAFGGDPGKITVMGESAGAKLSSVLLVAPGAKGKYRQLVLESGGVNCIRDTTTARAIRQRLMDTLGITDPKQFLTLPVQDIIAAQAKVLKGASGTNYFGPMADDKIVYSDAYNWLRKHPLKNVRVLLGSNQAEALLFMNIDKRLYHPDVTVLRDWFGKNGDLVQVPSDTAGIVQTLSRIMYQLHTYRLANVLGAQQADVWLYSFEQHSHGKPATHGQELAYIWGSNQPLENPALQPKIHADWVNFIKGKNPWTKYDSRKLGMIYGEPTHEGKIPGYEDPNYPAMGFLLD